MTFSAGSSVGLLSLGLGGKVAVVIGGTGTLGSRMAGAPAEAGARAVVVGRDRRKADAMLERLGMDSDLLGSRLATSRAARSSRNWCTACSTPTRGSTC